MRQTLSISVLLSAMIVAVATLGGEAPAGKGDLNGFLAGATNMGAGAAPQPQVTNPPAEPAVPEGVEALKGTLTGNGEALFDAAAKMRAAAFAALTCGPEIAVLMAEETHLQDQIMRLELGFGDVTVRLAKEREAMKDALKGLERFYAPGSDQYKAAVIREVERRKPRLENMDSAAATCPKASEALKDRLCRVTADREYLEWSSVQLVKSDDNVSELLSGVADGLRVPEPQKAPPEVQDEFLKAQTWLKEHQIELPARPDQVEPAQAPAAQPDPGPPPRRRGATERPIR